MKSYLFEVIIEPDEDVFHAYVPVLEERGASTWGYTKEEALKHIQEVTKMVIESMIERQACWTGANLRLLGLMKENR